MHKISGVKSLSAFGKTNVFSRTQPKRDIIYFTEFPKQKGHCWRMKDFDPI